MFRLSLIKSIKAVFFLPPPEIRYLILLSVTVFSIPFAIRYPVKFVIVEQPFSNERPLANELSKSLISKDLEYVSILKFSIIWLVINWSILPDFEIFPFSSNFLF